MRPTEKFHQFVQETLDNIQANQGTLLRELGDKLGAKILAGKVLWAFGTGHSHVIAEELYIRAGRLFPTKAILEPEFMLHGTKWKSTALERIEGISRSLLELNEVRSGDAIIIISNSGRNPVPVEMAVEAKKMGLETIAITNLNHSKSVNSRHRSGKRLFECVDHVLDNCGVIGDTVLGYEDEKFRFGATSTITGAYLIQNLVAEIIDSIKQSGQTPPVLLSSNVDGSDEYNERLLKRFFEQFPELKSILK